jgi:hypothetical protein
MVCNYSITSREVENIRQILHSKIFKNLRKHNMILPHEDIEEITSELLVWVLEKVSTTTSVNTIQTIPFISEKLITMFISSYVKHKYHEIPVTSLISDDEHSNMDVIEHLMYITNNVDEINIDDTNTDVEDEDQSQIKIELDDFQIMQIVDELMNKLERKKRYGDEKNNDSKFVVSKKLIRKYLYLLLKHGIDDAYRYKDTLSDGKKYRLEKNLELLSTLV